MPLNPYFTAYHESLGNTNEQDLFSGMIRENITISGQEYYYIPRELSDRFDQLFGEDVLSSFSSHAKVVMWLENFTGYGGESEVLSKFGLEVRDTASFIIHRDEFAELVVPIVPAGRNENIKWRPCEGDLIYVPFSQSLMEIKFVEDEYPGFYQLKKKYVWSLRCELVQLNNDRFNTGIPEVDDTFGQNINRLNNTIRLEDGSTILWEDGGSVINDEYEVSVPYNDLIGYGENAVIKKEFMDIMDFSSSDPFNERF
jgi:Virus neck protein